ncbi:hypothetical protein GGX14DRAFT_371075, partial [Mycena pura]
VVIFPLPDGPLSIRVFPGDVHPRNRLYFFDVYDKDKRTAVNSPRSFRFSTVRPKRRLFSTEEAHGIRQEDIPPGEERFLVQEGTACRLQRTGKEDFLFRIPCRPQPVIQAPDVGFAQPIPFAYGA